MTKKESVPKFERVSPDERKARLIEAGIACLAKGGIQGFTVDNICREAGTSRGLITHHFGSKSALLTAIYGEIYGKVLDNLERPDEPALSLDELIEVVFNDSLLNRDYLNVWLALWGEIAVNPALQLEHRKNYALYRERIARLISVVAKTNAITVDSYDVATVLISLVDGLWLEQCIDPGLLSLARAKDLCHRALAAVLMNFPRDK